MKNLMLDLAIADIKKEHVTIMSVVSVMLSRMVEPLQEDSITNLFSMCTPWWWSSVIISIRVMC